MSTSDELAPRAPAVPVIDARFAKRLAIVNGCVPLAILGWDALNHQLGVNDVNFAIRTTGLIGLVCLVLSLVVTPLRRLTGWTKLIAIRRNLGVLGFTYIAIHFAIFFLWDRQGSVSSTAHEIVARVYLWFGFGALVLMIPLVITSTDAMVSRLGARRWKRLHRLAYPIAIGGVVHYYLLVKSDTRQPMAFAIALGALLGYRAVAGAVEARRRAKRPRPKRMWSGELAIARITQETPDVKTFRFAVPGGGPLPFVHEAGQYLNLALAIDGKRVNRSYTIASPPSRRDHVEISVKRAANGYGSKHLHDTWREGDLVKISAPAGKFFFTGRESERVVLIAGGIGITPMMAVTRDLTDRGWRGDIYLIFAVRTRADVVFERELDELRAKNSRLHVLVVLTSERGRLTAEMIRDFVPDLTRVRAMLCGPDAMMTAARALLVGLGVPDGEIHQEAFLSPPPPVERPASAADEDPPLPDGETATVEFARSGVTAVVTNATTLLEAAEENGVELPFECRSGVCGQCKTRLVLGRVRMETSDALTPRDRERGVVLACQAHATRNCVVDA